MKVRGSITITSEKLKELLDAEYKSVGLDAPAGEVINVSYDPSREALTVYFASDKTGPHMHKVSEGSQIPTNSI